MPELLLLLAVAGIVLTAVVPAVGNTLRSYRRNGAARQLLAEIRLAQSLAVQRHEVFGLQWGGGAGIGLPADRYRVVRDTTGTCGFPGVNAPTDDTDVIRGWRGLSTDYPGMTIQSITDNDGAPLGGVMFDSLGAAVNTCTSVSFPVTVTLADATGTTRTIRVRAAGGTVLQ